MRLCENPIYSGSRNLQAAFTGKYRRLKPAATTLFLFITQPHKEKGLGDEFLCLINNFSTYLKG
jgi:hypothetical protein